MFKLVINIFICALIISLNTIFISDQILKQPIIAGVVDLVAEGIVLVICYHVTKDFDIVKIVALLASIPLLSMTALRLLMNLGYVELPVNVIIHIIGAITAFIAVIHAWCIKH